MSSSRWTLSCETRYRPVGICTRIPKRISSPARGYCRVITIRTTTIVQLNGSIVVDCPGCIFLFYFFFVIISLPLKKKTYILPIGRDEIGRDTPRIVGTCPRTCEPITSPVRFAVSTGDDNEELLRDIIIFVIMILIKVYAIRVPTRRIKFSID